MGPESHAEKRGRAIQDALNWIHKNNPQVDENPDEDTVTALSKITGLHADEADTI